MAENNSIISEFENSTINPKLFQIEDVANDNACFYRAISNCLNHATKETSLNKIKNIEGYGKYKTLKETYNNSEWGYLSEKQDLLARYLQGMAYKWIEKNYKTQLKEYDMDMGTMILLTHEIDIDTYLDRYKYFAGDIIVDEVDIGKVYKSGEKKGEAIIREEEIEDRWGGTPEQIALSEAYKLPIIILTSQKLNLRSKNINTGKIRNNKAEKGVRFRLLQIIGKEYLKDKDPIFILWKKHNRLGHYMSLYLKNKKNLKEITSSLN